MEHHPLSRDLEALLREEAGQGVLTLNQMLRHTEGRGVYLLMILFSLPFFTPMPLPGLSNILGIVIIILAVRLALNLPPGLPRFIGARPIQPQRMAAILKVTVRVVRFMERFIRPRRTRWMRWPLLRMANASLLAFMAFLLALPLPPVIPFSNAFPSYAIILIAASMMEEDGWMIWVGYAVSLGTVVYFVVFASVVAGFFARHWNNIVQWLQTVL